ncbi:unnamed protein product [marine sediment metagenome]|uniref:Uncharacterized protein n=1 Tax=marine sediment metagenome TaxID=412755 RepID=X0T4H8_9ZZZZ
MIDVLSLLIGIIVSIIAICVIRIICYLVAEPKLDAYILTDDEIFELKNLLREKKGMTLRPKPTQH